MKNGIVKNILTIGFGLATVATFLYPNDLIEGFYDSFNLIRISIMVIFLTLLLNTFKGVPATGKTSAPPWKKWVSRLTWFLPILALVFVVINVVFPELGSTLVIGGEALHFRPAIFVKMTLDLISCVIFVILLKRFVGRKQWLVVGTFVLLALVTFWMAMEEISWGQRIFKWETVGYFAENNMQNETNLHNLNTQLFQNALYFGGFLLLVVLPFFRDHLTKFLQRIKSLRTLTFLLPGAWMIGAFAMAIGFVDPFPSEAGVRWGSILFSLIATAAILSVYAVRLWQKKDPRVTSVLITLVVFLTVSSLSLTSTGVWRQDSGSPTEYIELFIALGIAAWAFDLNIRSKDKKSLLASN